MFVCFHQLGANILGFKVILYWFLRHIVNDIVFRLETPFIWIINVIFEYFTIVSYFASLIGVNKTSLEVQS